MLESCWTVAASILLPSTLMKVGNIVSGESFFWSFGKTSLRLILHMHADISLDFQIPQLIQAKKLAPRALVHLRIRLCYPGTFRDWLRCRRQYSGWLIIGQEVAINILTCIVAGFGLWKYSSEISIRSNFWLASFASIELIPQCCMLSLVLYPSFSSKLRVGAGFVVILEVLFQDKFSFFALMQRVFP